MPLDIAIPEPDLEQSNLWGLITAENMERLGATGAHTAQGTISAAVTALKLIRREGWHAALAARRAAGYLPGSLRFPHRAQHRLMRRQYPPQRGLPFVARLGDALVHLLDPGSHLLGQAG